MTSEPRISRTTRRQVFRATSSMPRRHDRRGVAGQRLQAVDAGRAGLALAELDARSAWAPVPAYPRDGSRTVERTCDAMARMKGGGTLLPMPAHAASRTRRRRRSKRRSRRSSASSAVDGARSLPPSFHRGEVWTDPRPRPGRARLPLREDLVPEAVAAGPVAGSVRAGPGALAVGEPALGRRRAPSAGRRDGSARLGARARCRGRRGRRRR